MPLVSASDFLQNKNKSQNSTKSSGLVTADEFLRRKEPVPSVVRIPQETPTIREAAMNAGYNLPTPLTLPEQTSEGRTKMIQDRAAALSIPQPPVNEGQRLIDIPANVAEGGGDSVGFGLPQEIMRRINNLLVNAGRMTPEEAKGYEEARKERAKTPAYKVGQVAGYIPPGAAIERGITTVARPLLSRLPGIADNAVSEAASRLSPTIGALTRVGAQSVGRGAGKVATGAAAGAIEAAAQEGADVALRRETFDPENIGIGATIGGAAGAIVPSYVEGVQSLIRTFRPQQSIPTEVLALPEPRARGNVNQVQTPEVINAGGIVEPIGLPEPSLAPPTTARIARKTNPFREKLEAFAKQMEGAQLPPGREREVFLEAWGRFAGPNDPDLETVIDLAYPARPNRLTPDLPRRARETQYSREVAGVPLPVRSLDDRYQGGVMGTAAMPETVVGRRGASQGSKTTEMTVEPSRVKTDTNGPKTDYKMTGIGILPNAKKQLSTPTIGHIVGGNTKPKTSLAAKADQSYIDIVDDIFALKRFDEVAEKSKGRALQPTESTYQLAMASRGADQISKQSLTNKLVNLKGDVVGDSLKDALTGVTREQMRNFEDYLVNKHAITRFGRGERVFDKLPDGTEWTPEKGKEIVDFYNNRMPNLKEAEEGYRKFNDNFNQTWLVDTGLLPKEVIDAWKRENPTYIDNQRQFSELEKIGGNLGARSKSGFGGQKAPVKGYSKTGSKRKIISPMESMIKRYDESIKAAKRNAPMQAMVRNIQENPEAFKGLAEIVPDAPFNLKNIDVSTPEGLEDMLSRIDDAYEAVKKSTRKDLDNVVPVMVEGQPVYVKIHNRQLLDAVLNTNPQILKGITGIAAKVANLQKNIYTGVNPLFTFARSIFRDPISAYVNSKTTNNPLVFLGDLAQATKEVFTNGQLYQEFKNIGGGYTSPVAANNSLLNRTKRDLLPNESKLNGIALRSWDRFMEMLDKVETIPRLGEFKRAKGTGSSVNDRLRGLAESQEVSINFKRRGAKTRELEGFWIYLNSAIQSLDKTIRAFKDQPIATPSKITLAITTPAMLLYAYNRNDPNYQKLRESEKDRFLHIPIGGGKFARYPIPPELAPFANVPRRLLDKAFGNNEAAWNDFGRTLLETLVPPGVSGIIAGGVDEGIPGAAVGSIRGVPVIGPSVEAWANKSWLNSPIVPGYLQDQSPRYQSDADTSQIAQFVSRISPNTSPMKTDYMIRSIGGDYGKALTGGLNTQGVVSRFVVDSAKSNKIIDDFYKLKEKYDQAYADREIAQLPVWYNDNVRKVLGKVSRDMSAISTAIREIKNSDMPKTEKDSQIEALQQQRMQMAQQVTEGVKGIK